MADQDGSSSPNLTMQSVGSGIAAVGGFALGGPIGAIVAGMSAPYLIDMTQRSWEEIAALRRNNVTSLVGQASARLQMNPEELHAAAMSSTDGTSLFADALQASAETLDERKVAGLAKALANGLMDDQAAVDENLMIVRALADLEAPHVRLLGSLSRGGRGRTLNTTDLAMVAVLERNGLASDDAHELAVRASDDQAAEVNKALAEIAKAFDGKRAKVPSKLKRPSGTSSSRTRPRWKRTSFGSMCLEHLHSAAVEVHLEPMDEMPTDDREEDPEPMPHSENL